MALSTGYFWQSMRLRLGGGGVKYIGLIVRKRPPLDGYVAVCLLLTIKVYANAVTTLMSK